jgi:hypothetical protein
VNDTEQCFWQYVGIFEVRESFQRTIFSANNAAESLTIDTERYANTSAQQVT